MSEFLLLPKRSDIDEWGNELQVIASKGADLLKIEGDCTVYTELDPSTMLELRDTTYLNMTLFYFKPLLIVKSGKPWVDREWVSQEERKNLRRMPFILERN